MIAAFILLTIIYIKNLFIHSYFSYTGIFQSGKFKFKKIERLTKLLMEYEADRAVLFELKGKTLFPTAYSINDGIEYRPLEKIEKDSEDFSKDFAGQEGLVNLFESERNSYYSINYTSSFIYSKIKDSEGNLNAIILLQYLSPFTSPADYKVLNDYKFKIKEVLEMQKDQSKKLVNLLFSFLLRCIKLITIKNMLRIFVAVCLLMMVNAEFNRETVTMITLQVFSSEVEVPLYYLLILNMIGLAYFSEKTFNYIGKLILAKALGNGRYI